MRQLSQVKNLGTEMINKTLALVVMVSLFGSLAYAEVKESVGKAKEFKIFDWKIRVDKEKEDAPQKIKAPSAKAQEKTIEEFIATSKNERIVYERERVRREKEKVERMTQRDIDRANRALEAELQQAKEKSEMRIQRAGQERDKKFQDLDDGLRQLAIELMHLEGASTY